VGRLNWEKNFAMLIHAHANLIHKGVAHRLCIVGEGPERTTLEGLIKELKVDNTAILAGHQSNPYPYMASASFLAMSSVYEGYPTVVMEALVLGKPVVSSCAAAREVFGEYPCGVVTENNCTALEEGLERMLTVATLRKHCTASATERGADLGMERPVRRVEQMLEQSL
jgi:glycosyltransferase involved in cell wall biosynthesis